MTSVSVRRMSSTSGRRSSGRRSSGCRSSGESEAQKLLRRSSSVISKLDASVFDLDFSSWIFFSVMAAMSSTWRGSYSASAVTFRMYSVIFASVSKVKRDWVVSSALAPLDSAVSSGCAPAFISVASASVTFSNASGLCRCVGSSATCASGWLSWALGSSALSDGSAMSASG